MSKIREIIKRVDEMKPNAFSEPIKVRWMIDFPYDDLYDLWLGAMIDFENGEYNKYQNTMEMFNSRYYEFVRWVADTYDPSQGG